MADPAVSEQNIDESIAWRGLRLYAIYRLLLAIVLFGLFYFKSGAAFLAAHAPIFYNVTIQAYCIFAAVCLVIALFRGLPFYFFLTAQLMVDIVVLTALIHFSGGLDTGLGLLLSIVVMIGSLFSTGKLSFFYAALATIALFAEVSYGQLEAAGDPSYYRAGILGVMFFATALLTQILSKRVQRSENLMYQHASDASKVTALNQLIVDRLQVGVVTVDKKDNVYSINQSARTMLGVLAKRAVSGAHLSTLAPKLLSQLTQWRRSNDQRVLYTFESKHNTTQIMPNMTPLSNGDVVIFLDDLSVMTEQAQQMKMASLGRMAASIAHEIRNPLGAISHATELLDEAGDFNAENKNLLQIIDRHCGRVNGVIDAVLQLSRNKVLNKESFVLASWLEKFVDEFCESEGIDRALIILTVGAPLIQISFDKAQLRQIMWNLCSNAWHYSNSENESSQVLIRLQQVTDNINEEKATIDVIDNGPGVSPTALPQLFEPFNTERTGGVGLGLHLAREMAHANSALLYYVEESKRTCFRVTITPEIKQGLK